MSESGDWQPAPQWKGHDFDSARQAYDKKAARGLDDAVAQGKTLHDLLPESLTTDSEAPVVAIVDGTGSMEEWPATMFSKLPYLEQEGQEYLGKGLQISFGSHGDAQQGERYPVQARPFAEGTDLKTRLAEIVLEHGGGGNMHESSELIALYYARNCAMPNAVQKPIYIFVTDEMPYDHVTKTQAAMVHVKLQETISTKEIFDELRDKFSVYLVLKPYGSSTSENDVNTLAVRKEWKKYIDDEYVAFLPEAGRIVDVIFGIFAKETDRVAYFKDELVGRQKPGQIATVFKALKTVHAALPAGGGPAGTQKKLPAKSTLHKGGGGKAATKLTGGTKKK